MSAPRGSRKRQQNAKNQPADKQQHTDSNRLGMLGEFLFESAFQIVTWVGIGIAIAAFFYFLSQGNNRGTIWSGAALVICVVVMLALLADNYFRSGSESPEPSGPQRQSVAVIERSAFVGVRYVTVPVVAVGMPLQIVINFNNSGEAPATHVQAVYVGETLPNGVTPRFDYSKIVRTGLAVVNPGNAFEGNLTITKKSDGSIGDLVTEDFEAIRSGAKNVFVHGRIDFNDPSGARWAEFCYKMRIVDAPTSPSRFDAKFDACPMHNTIGSGSTRTDTTKQRPWITVKTVQVQEKHLTVGLQPTVHIELQNTGGTPAIDAEDFAAGGITDHLPDGEFPLDLLREARKKQTPVMGKGVVGPGSPVTIPITLNERLTAIDVGDLLSGNGRFIFVLGYVEYRDSDGPHVTTFCYRTVKGYAAMAPCEKWNTTD